MEPKSFEAILAQHCAPALMGLKAANLVSLAAGRWPELESLAARYNEELEEVRFLVLGHCRERTLLLVYRPVLMEEALAHPLAKELLRWAGYPVGAPLGWQLCRLMERLKGEGDFPHEVGLFLGYPPEDVLGFLSDPGGKGCKLCGTWKVYHDVEGAERKFRSYRRCKSWLEAKLAGGETILSLLGRREKPTTQLSRRNVS